MRRFQAIVIGLIGLILYTCNSNNEITIKSSNIIYKVECSNEDFMNWDSIIKLEKVVQLETTNESVIGNLYKGVVYHNQIYLLDRRNYSLLIFDENGRFLKKIGDRGKGPQEYLELRDFCISAKNIYTLDYKKINCYNIETAEYKYFINLKEDNGFNTSNFIAFNENNYVLWNSNPDVWNPNEGQYFRLYKYNKGEKVKKFFLYEHEISFDNRFYNSNNGTYIMRPVDGEYDVYKISEDSIWNAYRIDFGRKAITTEEIIALRNSKENNAYLKSNYFKNIFNVFEFKEYIYFGCIGPDSKRYEGLINTKTGKTNFGRWDYTNSPTFFYSDGEYLYGYYEPYSIIDMSRDQGTNSCFHNVLNEIENVKNSDNIIIVKISVK